MQVTQLIEKLMITWGKSRSTARLVKAKEPLRCLLSAPTAMSGNASSHGQPKPFLEF